MNLILQDATQCQMMDWKTIGDGEGGFETVLSPGAAFSATVTQDDEKLAKIAQAITQQVEYKVYTPRSVLLKKDNIFKRLSDGKLFEVLFDNAGKQTPASSAMDFRVTTARIWNGTLNSGGEKA